MLHKLSKFTYILLLFYIGWFQNLFFQVPRMSLILGFGMIILLMLYKMSTTENATFVLTKPIFIWLFFSYYALLSGLFVALDKGLLIDSLSTYIQILLIVFYIVNISVIEKDNKFFIKAYFIYSVIYMCTMLFWGVAVKGGRLALSENSNPNNDGLTLFYGVFCFLMLLDTKKINRLLLSLGLIGLFSYTIILTGSRKSFMALVILLFLWFFLVFRRYWKLYSLPQKIILLLVAVIISSIAMSQFISILLDSTLFKRLIEGGYSISSDKTRSGMYQEAIKFFIDNPLCGIGFNHYRLLSRYQTYSHSTYAEIISTTGIIGTLIYFLPYIIIIYNLFLLYIRKKGTMTSLKSLQYLILMATMLALGIGVIHFYNITDNIMFALMISFYQVEKNKQRSH